MSNTNPIIAACLEPSVGPKPPDPKTPPDPVEDECTKLKEYIDALKKVLEWRKATQLGGAPPGVLYPPGHPQAGKSIWDGHKEAIDNNQNRLKTAIGRYEKKRCNDPDDPDNSEKKKMADPAYNPSVEEWEKRNGKVSEWIKNHPEVYTPENWSKKVVPALATVGLGYLVYRVIRFLPSLAPPLWWTIPENAAIP